MRISWNPDLERHLATIPRNHPWSSGGDEVARYYDFKARPDLIRTALEDFRKLEPFEAIERFYKLVAWLNSDDSALESNDSLLRGPISEISDGGTVRGHITIFFRKLTDNVDAQRVDWLCNSLESAITAQKGPSRAELDYARWPTRFVAATEASQSNLGSTLNLRFLAPGSNPESAMICLDGLFHALFDALREVSRRATTMG